MQEILLLGANNPETLRVINAVYKKNNNVKFIGFLDNDENKKSSFFLGLPVLGGFELAPTYIERGIFFVNLITRDCITRYETSKQISEMGGKFTNLIHPSVNLEMVYLGKGNYIQENVILQADVAIGNNSSIHMGSLIGHESIIKNSVFIAHGCNISGLVTIEDGVFVGTGVSIVPRVIIGKFSVIGAGSVVIDNIPPYSVAVGNPARIIKKIEINYDNADII